MTGGWAGLQGFLAPERAPPTIRPPKRSSHDKEASMKSTLSITTRSVVAAAAIAAVLVPSPSAHAACVRSPAVNPIMIGDKEVTPAVAGDIVGVCVDVLNDTQDPQIGTDVTVEPGVGCGVPCFVVAWNGARLSEPLTVRVKVWFPENSETFEHTIPAGSISPVCIHAGMPCP